MTLLGIVLMLFGTICIACHAVTQRWLLRKQVLSVRGVLITQHALSIPVLAAALVFWPDRSWIGFDFSPIFWQAVVGTSLIGIFIQYASARSRELGEASLVAPVQAMTPGMVTVAALFLGERASLQGWLGIILIALGNYIHAREGARTLQDYLQPFRLLFLPPGFAALSKRQQERALIDRNALRWAYLSAVLGAFGLIFDGLVARNGNVALGYMAYSVMLSAAYLVWRRPQGTTAEFGQLRQYWLPICLVGLFFALHILFVATSFRLAPVAYIGSLKRFSIILAVLLSWLVLGERKAKRRLFPAGMVALGSALLAFDPSIGRLMANIDRQ